MNEVISSSQNPKIKALLSLQAKSSERREKGLFVVEGLREVERCSQSGYEAEALFVCPSLVKEALPSAHNVFEVSQAIYSKIAYRESTEGVIAEFRIKERSLDELKLSQKPLIVVLESVEKPGNIGAVLRSADAAGADAVIVCDPLTDLYNPNLIRASLGTAFSVPLFACSSNECIDYLKAHDIQILTAQLQDSALYYDTPMTKGTAIVIGTESTGLSPIWRKAADKHIRIPMAGIADSLNASVSAAILLFEAVRQRNPQSPVRSKI